MLELTNVLFERDLSEIDLHFLTRCRWNWIVEARVCDALISHSVPREAVEALRDKLPGDFTIKDFWIVTPDSNTAELRLTVLFDDQGRYELEQVRDVWTEITGSDHVLVAPYAGCKGFWRWVAETTDEVIDYGGAAIEFDAFPHN